MRRIVGGIFSSYRDAATVMCATPPTIQRADGEAVNVLRAPARSKSDLGWTRRILAHPRGMRSLGPYETAIADYSSLPACVIVEYANYGTTQCTVRVLKVHQQPGMSTALEMAKTHANGDIEAHNRNYQTSLPKV